MVAYSRQRIEENPLHGLQAHGQSVWLDDLDRTLVRGGDLEQLIAADGLRGMTSNPTIFQQAIAGSDAYDEQIRVLTRAGHAAETIFEALAVRDIQDACDAFLPVYDRTEGQDGLVSLEVAPELAYDSEATLVAARRLWNAVDRPNLLIKVPGTAAGAAAVRQLLIEGINVNVTLLFALHNYERIVEMYLTALETRYEQGLPLNRLVSVASFFVSRVDTLVDSQLQTMIAGTSNSGEQAALSDLLGKAAIANAKTAYVRFQEHFASERFQRLRTQGAYPQRLLWASTSTKNPAYKDVYYVEGLIGPYTINSMPRQTLDAFRDHGVVRRTLDEEMAHAQTIMARLRGVGIDYAAVTQQLEEEGVAKFKASYDDILATISEKQNRLR